MAVLIMPFIQLYTKSFTDAVYVRELSIAFMFVLVGIAQNIRIPSITLICAAGHYKQTRWRAVLEVIIAISVSLLLVKPYGTPGVLIGSFCSFLYRGIDIVAHHNTTRIVLGSWKRTLRRIIRNLAVLILLSFAGRPVMGLAVEGYVHGSILRSDSSTGRNDRVRGSECGTGTRGIQDPHKQDKKISGQASSCQNRGEMMKKLITNLGKFIILRLIYPHQYRKYCGLPLQRRKVIFLEVRGKTLGNSMREVYRRISADHSYDVRCHFLTEGTGPRSENVRNTKAFLKDMATAEYVFLSEANNAFACFEKRPETKVIQLWHGCGAFKRFGPRCG